MFQIPIPHHFSDVGLEFDARAWENDLAKNDAS